MEDQGSEARPAASPEKVERRKSIWGTGHEPDSFLDHSLGAFPRSRRFAAAGSIGAGVAATFLFLELLSKIDHGRD